MDREIFKKLEAHVFDESNPWDIWADGSKKPNKLPYFASWAIYDDSVLESSFEQIVQKNIKYLNGRIVFVGLNFSAPLKKGWEPWGNIRGNFNFRWLLDGTHFNVEKYKGAYITDLIKNQVGSKAIKVVKKINPEIINKNIDLFFEEIDMLGSDNIEMYLLGSHVEYLFKKYVMSSKKIDTFKKKVKKCQRIEHYSGQNTGRFRDFAPSQLGLVDPPAQGTPIYMLWNDLKGNFPSQKRQPSTILLKKSNRITK
jgi:hypothetical protein